jgi:hypothetical protein
MRPGDELVRDIMGDLTLEVSVLMPTAIRHSL